MRATISINDGIIPEGYEAVVIYCTADRKAKVAKTVEMRNCTVLADFDIQGNLVGVEVLTCDTPKVKGEKKRKKK